jgi:hypothetical protein
VPALSVLAALDVATFTVLATLVVFTMLARLFTFTLRPRLGTLDGSTMLFYTFGQGWLINFVGSV